MRLTKTLASMVLTVATVAPFQAVHASEATKAVVKAIESRDCVAAVRELNLALAGSSPEALLLSGAMFEQGLCLKPNLERAARLYQRAADAGAGGARARLASLYASPASGPDKGAALWWSLQANLPLPKACVLADNLRGNAEAFAQALTAWPSGLLDACVYVAGTLAVLDSEFIVTPASDSANGVAVNFRPAAARLDTGLDQVTQTLRDSSARVTEAHSMSGVMQSGSAPSPDQLRAQQVQEELQILAKQVENIGRDALARFPQPQGIDATWRIQMRVVAARAR